MLAIQVPIFIFEVACAMRWQFDSASFMNSGEKTASTPADSASRASSWSSAKETSPGLAITIPKRAIHISSFKCWRPCRTPSLLSPPALFAREKAMRDQEGEKKRNKTRVGARVWPGPSTGYIPLRTDERLQIVSTRSVVTDNVLLISRCHASDALLQLAQCPWKPIKVWEVARPEEFI